MRYCISSLLQLENSLVYHPAGRETGGKCTRRRVLLFRAREKLCEKFAPKLTNVIAARTHVIRTARVSEQNCATAITIFVPKLTTSHDLYIDGFRATTAAGTCLRWRRAVNQIPATRGPALFG